MATISTSTASPVFGYPSQQMLDRSRVTGYLYALLKNSSGNYELFVSTNNGTSWSSAISLTRASVQEWSNIYIDYYGHLHWCYRTNESSQDRIYYRRLDLNAGTLAWSSEVLVANPANGGVAGAIHTGIDMAVAVGPTQWYVAIAVGTTSGANHGVTLFGVTAIGSAAPYANNNNFAGTRQWLFTGSGRITPSADLSHTGDAKTNPTPDLWVAFGRSKLYVVRLAWNGNGWIGPTAATLLDTLVLAHDSIAARWDGTAFLSAVQNPADTSTVRVYERNASNSSTTKRTTPTHTTGVIRSCAVNYNTVNRDIRVFAVGTSTAVVYFTDFIRATGLWSSWAVAHATAVLLNNSYNVRESTHGRARHDLFTAHSGPTQVHTALVVTYAPTVPTWELSGKPYTNGGAADTAASLDLDWAFSSPDPVDAQTAYAISRQIGAGALSYFRASDSTWQSTEQKNTSSTTSRTLASSWGSGSDANHTYKVKVWDASDTGSSYSEALVLVPSVKVNPSITAPTVDQVLTTNSVTMTWTASEQTAYRVQLATNPGGVVVHDSGWVTSTDLTYTPPVVLADGTGWTLTLETKNNEGLTSTAQTRNFTIDYLEPETPTLVATAVPASGWIAVVITNPAPSGGRPALTDQELWRRPVGDTTTGVRLVTGLASGATHNDWKAVSGTSYEYRVQAFGVNGTSIFSAWTT